MKNPFLTQNDHKENPGENFSLNVKTCLKISNLIQSTLGPTGMDKMIIIDKERKLISNDGATILNSLKFPNPIAKILVEISKSQDFEVGDGTTTVCLLATELILNSKNLIDESFFPTDIIAGFKKAALISTHILERLSLRPNNGNRDSFKRLLISCCATTLNSKLISGKRHFFSEMIVDIALSLGIDFDPNLISVKAITGGSLNDSFFFQGLGIKKPFSYAGFEKQKKKHYYPRILLLDIELELKTGKTDSEAKINNILKYRQLIDTEWSIIYEKLDKIIDSKARVIFSKQSIGDLATQFFSERGVLSGGRIDNDDLSKLSISTDSRIISAISQVPSVKLGMCEMAEEKQIGNERYIFLAGCLKPTFSIILRGNSQKLLEETKRCLNDGIIVVKKTLKSPRIVGGAGSIELKLASKIRNFAKTLSGKEQTILIKFAQSLEIIPKTLCKNSGLDQIRILSSLRSQHANWDSWAGVDIEKGGIINSIEKHIWEPLIVKTNMIQAATEAACSILSIDLTLDN